MDLNPLEDALGQQPEGEETHAPEQAPAEAAPETPEAPPASESPSRGPDGKFVAKPASPEATQASPPEAKPEPGQAPLAALLDEREKRQASEKALKALQDQLEAERRDWQAQNPPDAAQAAAEQRYADNLRYSKKFAAKEYGSELVEKVHAWAVARCDADPFFNAQMRASDDPYEAAIQAYNREQIAAQVSPADFEAFKAWQAAQAAAPALTAQTPQPVAPAPPRSLANAVGNGLKGEPASEVGEGAAFAATIA